MVNHKVNKVHKVQTCPWNCVCSCILMFLKYKTEDAIWITVVIFPLLSLVSGAGFPKVWRNTVAVGWVRRTWYQKDKKAGSREKIDQIKSNKKWQCSHRLGELLKMTTTCCLFTKRLWFAKNSAWSICMRAVSEGRLTQWLRLRKEADSSGSGAFLRRKSRMSAIISEYISHSLSQDSQELWKAIMQFSSDWKCHYNVKWRKLNPHHFLHSFFPAWTDVPCQPLEKYMDNNTGSQWSLLTGGVSLS